MKKIIALSTACLSIALLSGCAVSGKDYNTLVKRVEQERAINNNLKSQLHKTETDLAKVEEANVRYREALEKALQAQETEVVVNTAPTPKVEEEISKLGAEIEELVSNQDFGKGEFNVVRASHAVGLRLDDGVDLLFRPGSWSLTTKAKDSLKALSQMLKETLEAHPDYLVRVDGHTDADKIRKAKPNGVVDNTDLGYQRANTVRKFLIAEGIDEKKIAVLSAGEWMPVSSSKSKNRRVEIWVSTPDGFSFGAAKSDPVERVSND